MAKLLTLREMELFHKAVDWYIQYKNCNPDVGWGLSKSDMAMHVAKSLSFKIDEDDIAEVCETIIGS